MGSGLIQSAFSCRWSDLCTFYTTDYSFFLVFFSTFLRKFRNSIQLLKQAISCIFCGQTYNNNSMIWVNLFAHIYSLNSYLCAFMQTLQRRLSPLVVGFFFCLFSALFSTFTRISKSRT